MFAELFYGFTIISRIIVQLLKEHFETQTPVNFIRFNGISDNFLNICPLFPQQGGKYMNKR